MKQPAIRTSNTQCINCVRKHLSQAMVIHEEEVPLGYAPHIHRVVGHLAEASREALPRYRELAQILRDHRLLVMDDPAYLPPYGALLEYVETAGSSDEASPAPSPDASLRVPV